ncbi:MAG: gliding motility protein, partial [Pedobacter sp.]|nr:gliding motility protein [Pedobacter sp.]
MASRGMQNLTAHYNILYNAKELINLSEKNIQLNYSDNYDRVISVYKEPNESLSQSELKNLDGAILKANTIANEKSLSKYVDDAYFLIAKANHLKSNFFNAVEFFNYVYINYPAEKEIRQAALAWKARSLIASDRLEEA